MLDLTVYIYTAQEPLPVSIYTLPQNPFLPGESDLNQLQRIFETLGTPTEDNWPGVTMLPDYVAFKPCPGIPLSDIFIAADDHTIKLLEDMLRFDPNKRINCTQVCIRLVLAYLEIV